MSSTEPSSPFCCAAGAVATWPAVPATEGGSGSAGGGGRDAVPAVDSGARGAASAVRASCPMPRKLVGPRPELLGRSDPDGLAPGTSRDTEGLPSRDNGRPGSGGGAGRRSYGRSGAGSSPRSSDALLLTIRRGDEGNDPPPPPPLE